MTAPTCRAPGELDPGRLDFTHVPGERTVANWLAAHFRDPALIVPGSAMPMLGLSEPQIDALTLYMLSLRRGGDPDAYWPKDRIRALRFGEREFATDGGTLYATFCAGLSRPAGRGHALSRACRRFRPSAIPISLAVASDDFIRTAMTRGRPGRRMPAWGEKEGGLRASEIEAVLGYLRTLGGVARAGTRSQARALGGGRRRRRRGASTRRIARAVTARTGAASKAPALNNPVLLESATDTYLYESIARGRRGTAMNAFSRPSTTHAALAPEEIEDIVATSEPGRSNHETTQFRDGNSWVASAPPGSAPSRYPLRRPGGWRP